jgi:DNA-directed RNA polymerase specialized sigma24 family protein
MNNQIKRAQRIFSAFQALSPDERKSLSNAAKRLIIGTTFSEADDLLHEALARTVDGRRNYPSHIEFGPYMNMTMRSIAHANRFLRAHIRVKSTDGEGEETRSTFVIFEELAPSAEDEAESSEALENMLEIIDSVRDSLGDDRAACAAFDGMMLEESPLETRRAHCLDAKAYDSARKRVDRRLRALRDALFERSHGQERPRARHEPIERADNSTCSSARPASRASVGRPRKTVAKTPAPSAKQSGSNTEL